MRPFDPALLPHLRPASGRLAVSLTSGVIGGLLTVAQAFALGHAVVAVVQDPGGTRWHAPAIWLAVIVAGRALTSLVMDVWAARAADHVGQALRRRLLAATLRTDSTTSGQDALASRTGELTTLATRGIAATEPYLTRYLPTLVLAVVLPVAAIAAIWWLDWLSGLIVVLTIPLIPVFAVLIGMVTRDRADAQWRTLSALSGHFLDIVKGLPTLVVHRRASAQSQTIAAITDRYRRATVDTLKVAFLSSAVLEMIATISVALVAVNVGLRLAHGGIAFDTALVVLLLAPEAYWPLRRVGAEFHAAAEGSAAFAEVDALLTTQPDGESPLPAYDAVPAGPMTLRGVGFTFPGREQPALAAIEAVIPERGLTVISGPSGCGKSTLLGLLSAELTPSEGSIVLAGAPLPAPGSWQRHLATATQRPWLTSASVADNLRIARPDADSSDLWAALERVALDDVVRALPDGIDTVLGEDGSGLSAGQRARLALARVVVADRRWIVLDEPTAHLDDATEQILLDTMRWLALDRAVITVAHRPALIEAADQVIELSTPSATAPAVRVPLPHVAKPALADRTPLPDQGSRWGRRTALALGAGSVGFGVALTATASWLITRASEQPPVLYLLVAIVGVRLFGLGRPVLRWAERVLSHDAALRLLAQRRARVYDELVPLVPGGLGRHRGDVLTSIVDDVDALVDRELRVRQPWWTAALVVAGATLFAAWHDAAAGVVVAMVGLIGMGAFLVARTGARIAEADFVSSRADLSRLVAEFLESRRHLGLWQAGERAIERVSAAGARLGGAAVRTTWAVAAARAVPTLAGGAGLIAIAAWVAPDTGTSPAMLALLLMLPIALAEVLVPLADAGSLSVRTDAAQARLDELAHRTPLVSDPAVPLDPPSGREVGLRAESVSSGWGAVPAFAGISFDLSPGRRLGVVGPSGSGKSTLAATLVRFIDPVQGRVALTSSHTGGTDQDVVSLREMPLDAVRERVGFVDDDPHIFSSTIAENVRLARPDASDAEVTDALIAAHLEGWVASLPRGIHTFVGEGHSQVSGGERARIAIARSVLADHPVLVLDEPIAHLDTETALRVFSDLVADRRRAIVWITHSRVGLDQMDEVVSLSSRREPHAMRECRTSAVAG